MSLTPGFTPAEETLRQTILAKDAALRLYLERNSILSSGDAAHWLHYLATLKNLLGNFNNDVAFVATLLVKAYLAERFKVTNFDAAGKPQGASGIDIEAISADGKIIVGELKTTRPYQPNFGAAQRANILKDLVRLANSTADHRFMFVIDDDAFRALCTKGFATRAPGVEVVELLGRRSFIYS